jgi:steroid 5-alpha reductase family enzyme
MLLKLLALAWVISAAAMAALWLWQRRGGASATIAALWPALVGGLSVLYATLGDGAWTRRSAIGWMMGSWGARLAIQGMYTRAALPANAAAARPFWFFQLLALGAAAASTPGLLAALNAAPDLSTAELVASALWVIGFTGETTADRQRLRFSSHPDHRGLPCSVGLWRYSQSVDRVFDGLMWCAYAVFGVVAVRAGV